MGVVNDSAARGPVLDDRPGSVGAADAGSVPDVLADGLVAEVLSDGPPPDVLSDGLVPDVLAHGLDVVFCGINPGCTSARLHQHFARRGNRFWPALHRSGFTPRQLEPGEQFELLEYGLGVTNLASRGTATAAELARAELLEGGRVLAAKVARLRPRFLAVAGVTAYRMAFEEPKATMGLQARALATTRIWVLPNPSGLNAHYSLPALVEAFAALRAAVHGIR